MIAIYVFWRMVVRFLEIRTIRRPDARFRGIETELGGRATSKRRRRTVTALTFKIKLMLICPVFSWRGK